MLRRRGVAGLLLGLALPRPLLGQPAGEGDAAGVLRTVLDDGAARACFGDLALRRRVLPGAGAREDGRPAEAPLRRLVLAVDASGSMAGRVRGETKMEAARRAALDFLSGLPDAVEVGLVAFGHRGSARDAGKAESCAAAEPLAELAAGNRDRVRAAVEALRPVGWTPLAAGIARAATLFQPSDHPGEQVLLVISDGLETCGGDPVAAARALHVGPTRVVVNIVGFDIRQAERARLAAVAEAGGGRFVHAANGGELAERLREARNLALGRDARFRAAGDAAGTRIGADGAAGRARVCVSLLKAREQRAVAAAMPRTPSALRAEVQALLEERHRRLDAALEAYAGAAGTARDAQLDAVARDLDRALGAAGR